MKSIKYKLYNLLGIVFILFISCEGELDPEVFDKLSPSNYFQNAEDAKTAVTGVYRRVLEEYNRDFNARSPMMLNVSTTDEFDCAWRNTTWETYRKFLWTASTDLTTDVYSRFVKGISNCVGTIAQIEPIKMDETLKARYIAELRTIIALSAYTLYDFYGPTAIVTDPEIVLDPTSNFNPERPTKEWMINFIETEARAGADALPVSYGSQDYGRVTKGTALTVLLKLAMHEKDWAEAVTISKEIMDLKYYELQSSYISIFAVSNEKNKEIIQSLPRNVSDHANGWLAGVLPSEYVEPNGIPVQKWNGHKVPWDMFAKYEDTDKRLEALWAKMNTKNGIIDIRTLNASWVQYGAIPYKYPADPAGTGVNHGNDVVVFRYADILLLRAEALNNLNGLNQESIDLINMIRNRSEATPISLGQFSDQQSLNDYILDERFRELFLEGYRRQDLIRHGKFLSEAARRGAPAYDDHFLLFPIPQSVIDENPKIQQNPGY